MLDMLFLSVMNMSITASLVILVILLVRLFLKKAPKTFSYALWAVVLFRLISPFSFESTIALLPINATPIPQDIMYSTEPQIDTGLNIIDNVVNPMLPVSNNTENSVNTLQIWVFVGSIIWVIGILAMLIYSIVQFIRFKRKLIGATPLRNNIYLADHISSPFVMGLIKSHIYLPSSMIETEQAFIIAHEQYHIKRFDNITRILGFIALTIHWFNPLVWLAFVLSGKDMEMSCDEAVMKKMGTDICVEYSQSLLRFTTGKKFIAATPLAFGEGDTKDRVKNVMKYKKPILWISIVAVVMVLCISVGFMTNPKSYTILNPYVQDYIPSQGNIRGNVDVESYKKISMDFDVGADKYGEAVFKNPHKAFETFEKLYADGIEYLQKEYDLPHLSLENYDIYKTYGWQMTDGTKEQESQVLFISRFLDIYENSFIKGVPDTHSSKPTEEETVLNDLIPMVMVDDKIYTDTGKIADSNFKDPELSHFDGTITSAVNGSKRPTQNDQSNFGMDFGYRVIDEESIAIYINEEWYRYELEDVLASKNSDDLKEIVDISKHYIENNEENKILDYEQPKVEKIHFTDSYKVFDTNKEEFIDIQGKTTYKVTYETEDDSILGPISLYIDVDTMEAVGFDARK